MLSIIYRLAWKEFHELKWSVAATILIAATIPAYFLFHDPSMGLFTVTSVFFVYPVLAGALFGAQAAAGERVNRVAPFLTALPVSPQVLGFVKLLAACLATVVPLVLLALAGLPLRWLAPESARLDGVELGLSCALSCLTTIHVLLIVAVFGAGRPTEVLAATFGLGVFVLWGFATLVALAVTLPEDALYHAFPFLARLVQGVGPPYDWLHAAVFPLDHMSQVDFEYRGLRLVLWPLSLLALTATFVCRYEVAINPGAEWRKLPWQFIAQLRLPLPPSLPPLIWKSLREIGPVSLLVLGVVVLLSASWAIITSRPWGLTENLAGLSCFAGFVLSLLLGVGAFLSDLQPGVNTFWRSRAISPSQWFWTKYLMGLAALLLTLGLPPILCMLFVGGPGAEVGLFIPPWIAVYSLVVTATCLVRHTMHAAALGIGGAGFVYAAVETIAGSGFAPGEPPAPLEVVISAFLLTFAISTAVAWWAAVRDISVPR